MLLRVQKNNCLIKTWHIDRQLACAVTRVIEQKMDFYSTFHMPCLQKPSQRGELAATAFLGSVAGTAPSASRVSCAKQHVSSPVGVLQQRSPPGPRHKSQESTDGRAWLLHRPGSKFQLSHTQGLCLG